MGRLFERNEPNKTLVKYDVNTRKPIMLKSVIFDEEDEIFDEEIKLCTRKICVIGVGGVGVTAVTNMAKTIRSDKYTSVEFMAADYPSSFIGYVADNINICILRLNNSLSDSERSSIIEFIDNADILYVCTYLGSPTDKAAQTICELAKNHGIFTICAYTMPLEFEDNETVQIAKEQAEMFNEKTDAMIEVVAPADIGRWDIMPFFSAIVDRFRELIQMTCDLDCENNYLSIDFDVFKEMLCYVKNARFITENIKRNYTQTLSGELSDIIPKTTQIAIIHLFIPIDFNVPEYDELIGFFNRTLKNTKGQTAISFNENGKYAVSVIEAG